MSFYSKKELLDSLKPVSKWSKRFMWAGLAHGIIATVLGLFLAVVVIVAPSVAGIERISVPSVSSATLAALFAFVMYVVVGVLGAAVSSLFYYHIEIVMGKTYSGRARTLAWIHLVLMNAGITGATWTIMLGCYFGGSASQGGLGSDVKQVADRVVMGFVPIAGLMFILTGIGALAGSLGFLVTYRKK